MDPPLIKVDLDGGGGGGLKACSSLLFQTHFLKRKQLP